MFKTVLVFFFCLGVQLAQSRRLIAKSNVKVERNLTKVESAVGKIYLSGEHNQVSITVDGGLKRELEEMRKITGQLGERLAALENKDNPPDIDECKDGTHNCSRNANCTNTDGAFNCTCIDGYRGDGVTCKDIDECKSGTHNCSLNATCTNTNGSFSCTCFDGLCGDGVRCKASPVSKNCVEVLKRGGKTSGVYTVDPDCLGPIKVFCDQETSGGGWTVFQRRQDGSVKFRRGWSDYKTGFGNLKGEFWLGLDKIYRLTNQIRNRLRVELEDTTGNSAYAEYDYFAVSSENDKYRLSLGTYSGNAGDSLSYHRGAPFSTKDSDNDSYGNNCAVLFEGAWWYKACHTSNLNGLYHHGKHSSIADGVYWHDWKGDYYSAERAEMKIRPVGFKTG